MPRTSSPKTTLKRKPEAGEATRGRSAEPKGFENKTRRTIPRIGVHLSTSGGVFTAAERAHAVGANTFQIFSSSPRMWRAASINTEHCDRMRQLRERYDCAPLVIHTSYLVNLCSQSEEVRAKSIQAFRGEIERALSLGAQYLVLHPGSWRGLTHEEGLRLAAESIAVAIDGLAWQDCDFRVLIENTAGSEFSLGGSFEQVAELIDRLRGIVAVGACLDTCHIHVAGYDIVSREGYAATLTQIQALLGADAIRVWHMNDAKAERGSKLDRHQHIGKGTIGLAPFRRLLQEPCFAHCAFIAETPVNDGGDESTNVAALRSLARS